MTKYVGGCLRVLGLSMSLLLCLVFVGLQKAEAKFGEVLYSFGEELARLPGIATHSAPRTLHVNGVTVKLLTASTSLEVRPALDRLQALCHSDSWTRLPESVSAGLPALAAGSTIERGTVIRREAGDEGYLACLDGGVMREEASLLLRLTEFGRTLDLKELGQLRYALARRRDGVTTLLFFWTEGSIRLTELLPATGDAPGRDLDGVPRPIACQRRLSAFEEGRRPALAIYQAQGGSAETVEAAFRQQLSRNGWEIRGASGRMMIAEQGGRRVVVRVAETSRKRVVLGVISVE